MTYVSLSTDRTLLHGDMVATERDAANGARRARSVPMLGLFLQQGGKVAIGIGRKCTPRRQGVRATRAYRKSALHERRTCRVKELLEIRLLRGLKEGASFDARTTRR